MLYGFPAQPAARGIEDPHISRRVISRSTWPDRFTKGRAIPRERSAVVQCVSKMYPWACREVPFVPSSFLLLVVYNGLQPNSDGLHLGSFLFPVYGMNGLHMVSLSIELESVTTCHGVSKFQAWCSTRSQKHSILPGQATQKPLGSATGSALYWNQKPKTPSGQQLESS